jgi:hypothetical protein
MENLKAECNFEDDSKMMEMGRSCNVGNKNELSGGINRKISPE